MTAVDLDLLEVRGPLAVELDLQLGGDVAGLHAERLGQLEGDVGGEVAEGGVLRGRQLDAAGRRGEPRSVERGVECGEELVTDHGGRRLAAPFAVRRARAW